MNGTPAERKTRLHEIHARLTTLGGEAARALWELGMLLAEVREGELWREDGQPSFGAWLRALGFEREKARKAMLVAANFSADAAERYGQEKLVAGVGLLAATAREELPGDLAAMQIRVRGDGGRFETVPFPEATVAQVKEATRLLDPPRGKAKAYAGWASRLEARLPPAAGRAGQRVKVTVGPDGEPTVSVSRIPLAQWEAFLAAAQGIPVDD